MISFSNASHRAVLAVMLPLLAAPLPASGATARKQKPRAVASAPAKANNAIIALPLNPVVPSGQRLCSAKTPSGLGYTMLRPGTGAMPGQSDVVLVNYVGYLAATGAVFDQGMRSPLPVNGVIPGFSQGLQMMARSGIARLCIPAAMGYGTRNSGPIPANSDLVFQVEVVDFKTAAEVASMNGAQADGATAPKDATPQP
ncbi:FKBP-type peptidyl-prolyl cis-trans isomerase [Sphingomonas mollis]|uniref:Peptidyl-prolyl cis-trans isomerase n=1 Tax=Sphingomonas mollis TaxID=2795726 RepID=A0ABS0XM55_9SPHN|nr:FKBP-type peptidyl-prolyl cis-trans isomerase [Sphingomonas sp. BT553]MBJ6121087.1 FKBP-type peptidyl-prolyl cis-trans isomerase [Sphingomonas sp. BT553]